MSVKLCEANLSKLAEVADIPRYDRSQITCGVVHIGPSHFARGHLFRYFDEILKDDSRWGVTAISLNTPSARDALKEQDYLYSVTEQSAEGIKTRIVGSLKNVIVAPEDPQAALAALTNPDTKLVTLTVTQKGYGHDPATGLLDFDRDDIKANLSNMDAPSTTVGYLVAALERRMQSDAPPLTIMSCDNIPNNGGILRNVVLAYAAERSKELRAYIEDNISFPSTMVDRIVPSTSEANIFNCNSRGMGDAWPIVTEGFRQWAIEKSFANDVPDFESVGVIVANDVTEYELMKIRMLNGAHMALGCVGRLAGFTYVHEAMQDSAIARFVDGFMTEALSTLKPLNGVDYATYKDSLIQRLQNPHMKDELVRLARNGTQKLNGRVLDPLKETLSSGESYDHLAFATASWIQYLKGVDSTGTEFDIMDEKAITSGLQQIAKNSNGSPEPVMAASNLFGSDLQANKAFVSKVSTYLHAIQSHPMQTAIAEISTNRENIVVPFKPAAYA